MDSGNGLTLYDQWSNAEPLLRGFPSWVGGSDRKRLGAYSLYEQVYWNIPEAFKLLTRGDEDNPIYIPAARKIIETVNRYFCKGMEIIADPTAGTAGDQSLAMTALQALLDREKFYMKFNNSKRYGLIRGDWMFHLYADPDRQEGSRLSIFPLDPGSYFPIYNPDNIDEIIGVHIVDVIEGEDGRPYIDRLTYRKESGKGGPSPITVEEFIFEVDKWGGPNMDERSVEVVIEPKTLPEPISALPVYHIANRQAPNEVFGSSELRGVERLLASVNQSISDEDLALALEGLGVYTSTAGSPVDEDTGEPVPWIIGPGRVIELPNGKVFGRVQGVGSITPYSDHLKYLHEQLEEATVTSGPASGAVDVQLAESGIALALRMEPLLSHVGEEETAVTAVLKNMFYDLKAWFRAYEGMDLKDVLWIPQYGEKLPPNRKEKFDEVVAIAGLMVGGPTSGQPVVTPQWVRDQLRLLGYEIDEATVSKAIADAQAAAAQQQADAIGARLDAALANSGAAGGAPGAPPNAPPTPPPAGGQNG